MASMWGRSPAARSCRPPAGSSAWVAKSRPCAVAAATATPPRLDPPGRPDNGGRGDAAHRVRRYGGATTQHLTDYEPISELVTGPVYRAGLLGRRTRPQRPVSRIRLRAVPASISQVSWGDATHRSEPHTRTASGVVLLGAPASGTGRSSGRRATPSSPWRARSERVLLDPRRPSLPAAQVQIGTSGPEDENRFPSRPTVRCVLFAHGGRD